MKSAALLGLAIATLVVAAGSCSISHRSGDYACTKQVDCAQGRQCVDGFCIVAGSIDAPAHDAPKQDAIACPAGCTSCNVAQKTCTIDCSLTSCAGAVACPSGYHCDIQCNTDNSCRNGVSCAAGASCTIECSGNSSCRSVLCGPGSCEVQCSGQDSCRGVACGSSCACDVLCTGSQSCSGTITCTSPACDSGLGCTSLPLTCHSC